MSPDDDDQPSYRPACLHKLSQTQRDFLIEHIDRERAVSHNKWEDATRSALLYLKLITYVMSDKIVAYPKGTKLTDLGRETVCAILAQEADRRSRVLDKILAVEMPKFRHTLLRAMAYGPLPESISMHIMNKKTSITPEIPQAQTTDSISATPQPSAK